MMGHSEPGLRYDGTQGWKQFLTNKKEMLDAFDRAKNQAKAHIVETDHGRVAEAQFRKWLEEFLPKRCAVTSGYLVSQGVRGECRLPHFDVIVYDHLEAPVLWVEDNPDRSTRGMSRAIPVEHVRAVFEVKSSLKPSTAKEALDHLDDLNQFLGGCDPPGERYKKHLPATFFSAAVFFELLEEYEHSHTALRNLIPRPSPRPLPHFIGGIVFRGDRLPTDCSACINPVLSQEPCPAPGNQSQLSLFQPVVMSESVQHSDGVHFSVMLMWAQASFAMFAFDIVARLNGTYQAGRMTSFHGMNWPV
jgi:hypothetical protein